MLASIKQTHLNELVQTESAILRHEERRKELRAILATLDHVEAAQRQEAERAAAEVAEIERTTVQDAASPS